MSVLVGIRPAAATSIRTRPSPLRVAIGDECDVIVHGLWSMLFPFSHRVTLVTVDDRAGAHHQPHLVLHETQSRELTSTTDPAFDRDLMAGRAVIYSWNVTAAAADWSDPRDPAGFVEKTLPAEELVVALERIHTRDHTLGPSTFPGATVPAPGADHWPGQHVQLGRQESQVLSLISSGISNQDIADRLFVSINTVKSYIRSAYRKVGAQTRSQAMLWAIDNGFRELDGNRHGNGHR